MTNQNCVLIVFAGAISISGCTSVPKGTPASTQAYNAAADATAILGAVSGEKLKIQGRNPDAGVVASTRVEIFVTGLMDCVSVAPGDVIFEFSNESAETLTFGAISKNWDVVSAALLRQKETYRVRLKSQRTGATIAEKTMAYTGDAPWKIFLPASCIN
ncbi:MAG: hypothetical protein RL189_2955 [Pseudomonadota bacterium]|jgi:hypothetical protein